MEGVSPASSSQEGGSIKKVTPDYSGKSQLDNGYYHYNEMTFGDPSGKQKSPQEKEIEPLPAPIEALAKKVSHYRELAPNVHVADHFAQHQERKYSLLLLDATGVAKKMEETRETLRASGKHGRLAADYQEYVNKVIRTMKLEQHALTLTNGNDFSALQKALRSPLYNVPLQETPKRGADMLRFAKSEAEDAVIIEKKVTLPENKESEVKIDPWENLKEKESSRFNTERAPSVVEQPKNLERIKDRLQKRRENALLILKQLNIKAAPVAILEAFNKIPPQRKIAYGVIFAGASVMTGGALTALTFGVSTTSFAAQLYEVNLKRAQERKIEEENKRRQKNNNFVPVTVSDVPLSDKEKQKAALRAFIFGAGASSVSYFGIKEISEAVGPLYEKLQSTFNAFSNSSPSDVSLSQIPSSPPPIDVVTPPATEALQGGSQGAAPSLEVFNELTTPSAGYEEVFDSAKAEARNAVFEAYENTRNQVYDAYQNQGVLQPAPSTNIAEEIMKARQEVLVNIEEARRNVLRPKGM